MLIIALVTALVVLDLARLSAARNGRSIPSVLVASVPRALLPAAVAVTTGAWRFREALNGIAASGTGGMGVVARAASSFAQTTLVGVIAFITVIGAALAWSVWRRQLAPAPSAAVAAGRFWNGPSAAVAVAVLVAVGCASFAVDSAGHAAVGIIAPFARAALPGGGVPIPPPPPEYAFYVGMSGQAIAVVFERLITTTTTGGVTLCLVLIGLSVMSAALLPRGPVSRAGGLAAQAVAVTLVVSAGWYCVQLGAVVGWLGAVVRTIS